MRRHRDQNCKDSPGSSECLRRELSFAQRKSKLLRACSSDLPTCPFHWRIVPWDRITGLRDCQHYKASF
jgi:hypothetical protein